jgi:hypothetical protein
MPIRNPSTPIPGMARLTSEPYTVTAPHSSTKCAFCGFGLRKWDRSYYYPRRDVYSHLACPLLDEDEFANGYFLRTRGEVYEVRGRCLRCDEFIFARSWAFSSGELFWHFECAIGLLRGDYDADADLRGTSSCRSGGSQEPSGPPETARHAPAGLV